MVKKPRYSPHHHTGRHLPHHHTSYGLLLFVLLLAGAVLFTATNATANHVMPENPQAGSMAVTGRIPGPPPPNGATIDEPTDGSQFTTTPIPISGSCPPGTLVEIYKNDIFAGSVVCGSNGRYSLLIDLFYGENRIVVKVSDSLGQYGPDSRSITVIYLVDSITGNASANQLILHTNTAMRGVFPHAQTTVPMEIIGGKGPYAVSWDWGDHDIEPISRGGAGPFTASHTYKEPGIYSVMVRAADAEGQEAFVQIAIFVNGETENGTGAAAPTDGAGPQIPQLAWPIYLWLVFMVLSYWLGERVQRWRDQRDAWA